MKEPKCVSPSWMSNFRVGNRLVPNPNPAAVASVAVGDQSRQTSRAIDGRMLAQKTLEKQQVEVALAVDGMAATMAALQMGRRAPRPVIVVRRKKRWPNLKADLSRRMDVRWTKAERASCSERCDGVCRTEETPRGPWSDATEVLFLSLRKCLFWLFEPCAWIHV